MRRRDFIPLLGGAVAWPLWARAQPFDGRLRRLAILMPFDEGDAEYQFHVNTLREEMARLGWSHGTQLNIDVRWTTDNRERVRSTAASLYASNPDVVVSIGGRVIPVLRALSGTIPIVVPSAPDPVGLGWVESLARPAGNITGFTFFELSLLGKMLEFLKQIAPAMNRVVMPYNPDNPSTVVYRRLLEDSTRELVLEPIATPIHGFADIEQSLTNLADSRNVGVIVPPDVTLYALREQVVALLARMGVPAVYPLTALVRSGGLMSYGADRADLWRRAAGYVDRILRGERASDLPFQQPTKYQLTINLKTAKALGLEIPPTLLARADEVIE